MGGPHRSSLQVFMIVYTYTLICGLSEEKCPPGSYYDSAVARCDSCDVLCQSADIQGTKEDCHRYCPDYSDRHELTTPQKIDSTGSDDVTESRDTVVVIVGLTCATVLLTVIVAVVMVMRRNGRTRCKTCAHLSGREPKHRSSPVSTVDLLKPLREYQASEDKE